MKGFLILLIVFYLSVFNFALAANPLNMVINEVTWMGTNISANDEWIELYNNTENSISLDDWQMVSQDGTPKINLSGIIPANGFYLLERTDDTTVPNVPANQIYTGALGNAGETLELYDNFGNLIDGVDNSSGWSAGDNKTKQTMERINPFVSGSNSSNWQTSENPGGTPKSQNSAGVTAKSGTEQISAEVSQNQPEPIVEQIEITPTGNSAQIENYPNGIVFNEILPSPEGLDETEEWIEIYNQNDFPVDLSGWQISDSFGQTKTHHFPENSIILPKSYLVIKRPESGIILNNQEEKLLIVSPDKKVVDFVYYKNAVRDQSFARFSDQWFWTKALTPGSLNIQSDQENKAQKDSVVKQKEEEKALLAAKVIQKEIKQGEVKELSPLKVFGLALLIAGLSGTAILMLKRLIGNINNF